MKSIICLSVDFRENGLGLPSLLEEEIDGAPVLYHTVSRLTLSDDYSVVLLFEAGPHAESDLEKARAILSGLSCEHMISNAPDVANREHLRRSRLWSLKSWRGGIGGTSYYDEAGSPAALLAAAKYFEADAVGFLTADSPYADPSLASRLFDWHYERIRKARVTVTGVPPGLAPVIFNAETLESFVANDLTFAAALRFNPAQPQRDLTTTEAHYEAELELRVAPWRLTAHSRRQLEMMRGLAERGASPRKASALEVVRTLSESPELWPGPVPSKIEIEPTTRADAVPSYLAPVVKTRGPADMSEADFARILSSIAPHRDVVLSLGGLGEPLLHEKIARLVSDASEAGALGVHLATYGRPLGDDAYGRLVDAHLDALSVYLGAHTEDTYTALFGDKGLAGPAAFLERAFKERVALKRSWPLLMAEIVKMRPAESDIEAFFDHWFANCDWPVIRPYNDFAGQVEDLATIHMRTSNRIPCRKIFEELYIDAECVAYPCRQDIMKTRPLGNAAEEGVEALWHCGFMEELRAAHVAGEYGVFGLCADCKDWYYA